MAEAWEAALAGRLRVAEKLARAAIVGSEVNPRLWLDLGGILRRCGSVADAEEALRRAIAIAPTFGAAFAELAALQAAEGKWAAAERLQRRAVELLPHDAGARARLAEFTASVPADAGSEPENAAVMPPVLARTERFDWAEIGAGLRERGGAVLPALLSADECADLTALWSRDVFESASTASGGGAESRFLQRPFPTPLDALRTELYARLVPIAVEWQRAWRRRRVLPPRLDALRAQCEAAGQDRSNVRLLACRAEHGLADESCAPGRVTFPFRVVVPLRAPGAEPMLVDVRTGRRRERRFAAAPGDAVVLAAGERFTTIGGVAAAQPVRFAVAARAEDRLLLDLGFVEQG